MRDKEGGGSGGSLCGVRPASSFPLSLSHSVDDLLFSGYIFFAISTLLSLLAALQPLALLCHHTASLRHCFIVLLLPLVLSFLAPLVLNSPIYVSCTGRE